jgi:hypothetical protein
MFACRFGRHPFFKQFIRISRQPAKGKGNFGRKNRAYGVRLTADPAALIDPMNIAHMHAALEFFACIRDSTATQNLVVLQPRRGREVTWQKRQSRKTNKV